MVFMKGVRMVTTTDLLWVAFWPMLGILIVYFSVRRRVSVGLLIVFVLALGPIVGFALAAMLIPILSIIYQHGF